MMRLRPATLAATTAALAVVAALGVLKLPRDTAASEHPVQTEREARALINRYRRDAVAGLPRDLRYAEAVDNVGACPGAPDRYTVSSRYDLMPPAASDGAAAVVALRQHWHRLGYHVVNDMPGQTSQLLTEDPANGFRLGISQRAANFLRLAISSPCLPLPDSPVRPVLRQDLATARETYQRYVAGTLDRLAGDVAELRAAINRSDLPGARNAWLTAQLRWARIGAAYGSFGDFADAIDGLPHGLRGGVRDPDFTGLHRIEYGLWHGEPRTALLPVVDTLVQDVRRLRAGLPRATPDAVDLPLRVHEILEDALRFHLDGLTDFGGGAGLAETSAGVEATTALLTAYGPLLDDRRPSLVPSVLAGLDTLQQALREARNGTTWRPPRAMDPAALRRIEAALGGVLEDLAAVPGLLEVAGS